jgi:low molecular weight protein-tyrosine phosphatase
MRNDLCVLFVCTGNICRSPTAEGVMRSMLQSAGLADRVRVDSAGTHGYHAGEPPDERAQRHAARRGYRLDALRARRVASSDFEEFDLILAMDRGHLGILERLAPDAQRRKLHLFMEYAAGWSERDVPDPYYGGAQEFERMLDMIESGARGLLEALRRRA